MRGGRVIRHFWVLLVCGTLWVFPATAQSTEPRVALVIGNSSYGGEIGALANPANDARLIAETLRKVGFDVIEIVDADRKQMSRAIIDFGEALTKAGTQSTGLFYYAGHGIQVAGDNYLIPVNADISREGDVQIEAVASDLVLQQMDFAGNAVNIVILDACRNNPLKRSFRSQQRGLAEPQHKPRGSFIAYSTAPGDVAADGASENSPYTRALAAAIRKPGAALEEIFRDVRSSVMAATQQKQVPWDSSSLTAPFYFIPPTEAVAAPAAPISPPDANAGEVAYWNSIMNSSNPALFQSYLKRFPNGLYVEIAQAKLAELSQATTAAPAPSAMPEEATAAPEIDDLDATYVAMRQANLRASPSTEAKILGHLAADDVIAVTGRVKGKDWLRVATADGVGYVNAGLLAETDPDEIAAWRALKAAPNADAAQAFLKQYPGGTFEPKAEALLASLRSPAPAPAAAPAVAASVERSMKAGEVFRDCSDCPEMVVIPGGAFVMGAAEAENGYSSERPQHRVTIGKDFAVAKFETTIGDYATFIQRTGYDGGSSCYVNEANPIEGVNWKNPQYTGYRPGPKDPVVCISWDDAQAYVEWLSRRTGKRYRLLTEAEWEYAARAGATTLYPWGPDLNAACSDANVADRTTTQESWWKPEHIAAACDDGALYSMPVGRYRANAFGLYDMIGNVNEWVADCFVDSYATAPTDGSAVDVTGCHERSVRGGAWNSLAIGLRSASRNFGPPDARVDALGFRVARDL